MSYFYSAGVDEDLIRRTLSVALETGGDHADIYFQHSITTTYVLEDGEVNRAVRAVDLGAGVRVLRGDQTGYGYTEDLTAGGLCLAARTAASIVNGAWRPGPRELHAVTDLPARYPVERPWDSVPPPERLELLQGINSRTLAADRRMKKARITFLDQSRAVLIADSTGRVAEDIQPMTTLYLTCVAEDGGRREQGGYNIAGRMDISFYSPERLGRLVSEAVRRTTVLFEAGSPPTGEMTVVLGAGSSGILLHEAIGHGMEADFNRKGISIYSDRLGKPVAQPFVNIVDDGTQRGARGAINVDDEGLPAGKTMLVTGGVLTSYLHDRISAAHYKVAPTGSGRRESYRHAPMPRMRSTYMLPGPHDPEEIVRSVKRGIFCESFLNGQVRIGAGDFTFYVQNGYLIEDGKLTRPIKDVNIIGNGPEVLEQIDMVGDDLRIDEGGWTCGKDGQMVPVSQGLPTVRVTSLTVGGRGPAGGGR